MKKFILILLLFIPSIIFGQNDEQINKFKQLSANIKLDIWDKESSDKTIKIENVSYEQIPKSIDFRGTVVECLKWTDKLGDNLLIQSVSGHIPINDEEDEDKWELYVYLFRKEVNETSYKKIWKIYDYNLCFGVDWYAGFIPHATTITDIDKNGIAEISIPYVLICRGGMDPGTMKIIMYEGDTKYAIRGETMISCNSNNPYGGDYTLTDNLKEKLAFRNFLIKRWEINKCENERFY